MDPKEQSLRQLVKQFRNQQPVQKDKINLVRPGVYRGPLV